MSNSRKILFQLSGSIACYKACHVISRLVQAGHEVEVVATNAALKFVGAATLEGLTGKAVHTDLFSAGSYMSHIELGKWADIVVLCPASANTINKMSSGIGDDLISSLFLAHDFSKPYLVAPAMNTRMYQHPATQSSLAKLRSWGVQILETASGVLACGDVGEGKLLDPDLILQEIEIALTAKSSSARKLNVLITSGGTQEPIDGVRAITNFSTGKTGVALAAYFTSRGHDVTLLRARASAAPLPSSHLVTKDFVGFADLDRELETTLSQDAFDAVIHAAAVSDFSVRSVTSNGTTRDGASKTKIESGSDLMISLSPNPKLLSTLKRRTSRPLFVVGFKLTDHANETDIRSAVKKASPGADLIVHNDLAGITETSHLTKLFKTGVEVQSCTTKLELAKALEDQILQFTRSLSMEVRA